MNPPANQRYVSLDALRGIAVMGILLMNIIAFAMPELAYINPLVWGGTSTADFIAWAAAFVLVDGKMRGLFSLLFGASMLLVMERARAAGEDEQSVHIRRMGWLLVFGLAHYYLVWYGDILFLYAVTGFVAMVFVHMEPRRLYRWSIALFVINFIIWAALLGSMIALKWSALQPGADADTLRSYADLVASIGIPDAESLASEINLHHGSYSLIVQDKLTDGLIQPVIFLFYSFVETLALMLLGMALMKTGFMTGQWNAARYRRIALRCYAVGLLATVLLAWWCWSSGFDAVTTFGATFAWSSPFRPLLVIGHAAIALLLIRRFADTAFVARITAAGRAAFTNYLGTSIVMTAIFYGYGLGMYGKVDRAPVYLFVLGGWIVMLAWSKPWLDRFAYGPFEWLWRSLARGKIQPIRRSHSIAT